jgi:hypothetical protein
VKAWLIRQYRGFRIWFAGFTGTTINVAWFGASPMRDDNTEAFQRAFQNANKRTNAAVKSDPGVYNIKSTIEIAAPKAGEGKND